MPNKLDGQRYGSKSTTLPLNKSIVWAPLGPYKLSSYALENQCPGLGSISDTAVSVEYFSYNCILYYNTVLGMSTLFSQRIECFMKPLSM